MACVTTSALTLGETVKCAKAGASIHASHRVWNSVHAWTRHECRLLSVKKRRLGVDLDADELNRAYLSLEPKMPRLFPDLGKMFK